MSERGIHIPWGVIAWLWGLLCGLAIGGGVVLLATDYSDAGLACIFGLVAIHAIIAGIVTG